MNINGNKGGPHPLPLSSEFGIRNSEFGIRNSGGEEGQGVGGRSNRTLSSHGPTANLLPANRASAVVGIARQDGKEMALRILLVEKDMATAGLLVPSLERKGYQVAVAHTQRQAMSHIRSLHPDLLVLDVTSFGSNGYKVSDTIRARLDNVPAILLVEKNLVGLNSTATAFLTPPFTSRRLLSVVKKVATHLNHPDLQVGPLVLDLDSRTLRKGDLALHLRPKEATLLAFFMRNPGRILSRQEIMKQVWETDYVEDTRTLSVHIRWLRLKIEDDPDAPRFLRTVRGLGYRFEVPVE